MVDKFLAHDFFLVYPIFDLFVHIPCTQLCYRHSRVNGYISRVKGKFEAEVISRKNSKVQDFIGLDAYRTFRSPTRKAE